MALQERAWISRQIEHAVQAPSQTSGIVVFEAFNAVRLVAFALSLSLLPEASELL